MKTEAQKLKRAAYMRAWRAANHEKVLNAERRSCLVRKERIKEQRRARYGLDPSKAKLRAKAHYEGNKEKVYAKRREWAKANPEKARASAQKWRRANPHVVAAATMRRLCQKRKAMPVWACSSEIQQVYLKAKQVEAATGVAQHVDHIVPLQSDLVCGLHVAYNLQVLPAHINIAKSNKRWEGQP